MVNKLGSSHIKPVMPLVIPRGLSNSPESEDMQIDSEGDVDKLLCLAREGGVEFLNQLLPKQYHLIWKHQTLPMCENGPLEKLLKCLKMHRRSGNRHIVRN